jgi:hypothetical protein
MEDTIMSVFLESRNGGDDGEATAPRPPRRGADWCRSTGFTLPNMGGATPVLHATNAGTGGDTRRSVLFALIADNGTLLEVAERRFRNRTRYLLIHHQIGRTMVLGAYDSLPTDAQLADILNGRDREGGQARAVIEYQASGDSNINLLVPMTAPPAVPGARPTT